MGPLLDRRTWVVLGLLVLGPLGGFVAIGWLQSIANSHPALAENPYWDLYYTFAILVTSFSIAASIFGGAGLVTSKQRSAVIRAQTSIWLAGPVANGLFLFVAGKVAALVAVKGPDFFPGILLPLALAIAASVYLARSSRVRAKYSATAAAEEASADGE